MSERRRDELRRTSDGDGRIRTFGLPPAVFLVAMLAAALHLLPIIGTQAMTPAGWQFTGNVTNNPDYMQYRVWFRQTQIEGPIVTNVFTSEPNRPHLTLIFQFLVGQVANWASVSPEFVFAYAGSLFAIVLVLLLFAIVRQFVASPHQQWWVFLALLIGGGFGAHLKLFMRFEAVKTNPIVSRLLFEPLQKWPVFEDYRGHYIFTTLFDTHFLLNWTVTTACVFALYWTLRTFTWPRLALTAFLYGLMTLLHVYEGVTLVAITAAVTLLCWIKGLSVRPAAISLMATTAVVLACIGWQGALALASGIPPPSWQAVMILPTILFLAYPLAWVLGIRGIGGLWAEGGLDRIFLMGWALGCTALTLAGPFYPYPDRGTLTLQIPLGIIAGLAYFRNTARVSWRAALVAIFLLGATPGWSVSRTVVNMAFQPDSPATFLSPSHREIIDALRDRAGRDDILLAPRRSLLWLAPEYPGRHYSAHFFLTVDFERKQAEVQQFFAAPPDVQAEFLRSRGIRFFYVNADQDPARFGRISGVTAVRTTSVGSLFEYQPRSPTALLD